MADREDRNTGIIEEFRTNEGRVGGWFEGRTLLLLTHHGAKTGTERTNPLAYRRGETRPPGFAAAIPACRAFWVTSRSFVFSASTLPTGTVRAASP